MKSEIKKGRKWGTIFFLSFLLSLPILTIRAQQEGILPPFVTVLGNMVPQWATSASSQMELQDSNTLPKINVTGELVSQKYYIWDSWPLRNKDGSVAVIDGKVVVIGLTALREGNIPGERHGLATWRYFYTDGTDWTEGGEIFSNEEALGERQWAGSSTYDPQTKTATFYYTALGPLPETTEGLPPEASELGTVDAWEAVETTGKVRPRQQIAMTQAKVNSQNGQINFTDFSKHEVILAAQGVIYATREQTARENIPYVFRDPFYFQDPATGKEYLLFSATAGFDLGEHNGVVGLAEKGEGGEYDWVLQRPLLAAIDNNFQLERPNMLVKDNKYYLFFSSHRFTFSDQTEGFEGYYGFVADKEFTGNYNPLNGTGLVFANPQTASLQTYSYLVLPGANVFTFINYFNLGNVTLSEIGNQSRQWQKEHFGGTLAPLINIAIEGNQTRLIPPEASGAEAESRGVSILEQALGELQIRGN